MEDAEEKGKQRVGQWQATREYNDWRAQSIKLQDVLAPSAKLQAANMFRILAFRVIASQVQALQCLVPSTNSVAVRQVQTLPAAGPALLLELIVPPSMLTIGTRSYSRDA